MRSRPTFASFALAGLLLSAPALAGVGEQGSAPPSVDVVKVQGVVDPALSAYVRGTIESAEEAGATVVLQIDSRGSFGDRKSVV